MATRKRDAAKASRWRRRIQAQADSGMSVAAWCRQQRVTETSFYWWRRELARRDTEASARTGARRRRTSARSKADPPPDASFVPVQVIGEDRSASAGRIEIVLSDGTRVRLRGAVDRQALTDVLAALTAMRSATDTLRGGDAEARQAC